MCSPRTADYFSMSDPLSISVSVVALVVSVFGAWASLFRRGTIKMTRPTIIAFCYDHLPDQSLAKIYMRAALFSTGRRGQVIESMYLNVTRDGVECVFTFWGYGESKQLVPGSGLFVGEAGISTNHHFNPPTSESAFAFKPGTYTVQIIATLAGARKHLRLFGIQLNVPHAVELGLLDDAEMYFTWRPDREIYEGQLRSMRSQHAPLSPHTGSGRDDIATTADSR
jgi:hypothetical protein